MTGKEKCELLRQIRRDVAIMNEIPYSTTECTYTGDDCPGTCPKCDEEIRHLESELGGKTISGTISLSDLDSKHRPLPRRDYIPDEDDVRMGHLMAAPLGDSWGE